MGEAFGLLHKSERRLRKQGKDLLNRAYGAAVEAASALMPHERVDDDILLDRVRSRLGHFLAQPHEVRVSVRSGVVTLEGRLTNAERRRLREEVGKISGVKSIADRVTSRSVFGTGILMGLATGLALFTKGVASGKRAASQRAA